MSRLVCPNTPIGRPTTQWSYVLALGYFCSPAFFGLSREDSEDEAKFSAAGEPQWPLASWCGGWSSGGVRCLWSVASPGVSVLNDQVSRSGFNSSKAAQVFFLEKSGDSTKWHVWLVSL